MIIVEPSVQLLEYTPDPERLIERAGRVCWKSEGRITGDSHPAFIRMLLEKGHLSVLEHASATLQIITDRGISHEIVRHRIASFSQESTRYCSYRGEVAVVRPGELVPGTPEHLVWEMATRNACAMYGQLLVHGVKPQTARSVLPTCLKTELVMTANFREWMHFIDLRSSQAAHPDIRIIARMVAEQLKDIAPTIFGVSHD